jgi:hypothetical protein
MNSSDIVSQGEDGCVIRGNPVEFMGQALVAYSDILGMSRAIILNPFFFISCLLSVLRPEQRPFA